MKTDVKLPDKLSDLLELAVNDAMSLENSNNYVLNMLDWHSPYVETTGTKCNVCMAGAVMACTLKVPSYQKMFPGGD